MSLELEEQPLWGWGWGRASVETDGREENAFHHATLTRQE